MGQGESKTSSTTSPSSSSLTPSLPNDAGFRMVKAGTKGKDGLGYSSGASKYTAFSVPRESLVVEQQQQQQQQGEGQVQQVQGSDGGGGGGVVVDEMDGAKHSSLSNPLPPIHTIIEGSDKRWTFSPSGSTRNLDAIDPKVILGLLERVQAHVRKSHLLVDQSTLLVVEQMRDLEQQCAHSILAFTRLVATSNSEMELIGRAADELSMETRRSHDRISELVELTMRVRDCLPLEQRKQMDGGSALYRAAWNLDSPVQGDVVSPRGDVTPDTPLESPQRSPVGSGLTKVSESSRVRSASAVAALKHLHFKNNADQGQLLDDYNDEALVKLWLDDLLPRWDQPSEGKRRIAAARKGKGIPPSIRGAIWKRAIGNRLEITAAQFEHLCQPADGEDERTVSLDLIRHDLPRTFHRLNLFGNSAESFSVDLVKVLEAFARLNGDLGYVQGMSYLAGMLLLNMGAYDAWVAMNNMIIDNHFFVNLFRMNVPGIVQHARIYEMVLSENNPEIYGKLHDLAVTSDHYLLDWFMTVFTRKLPIRICTRVWDLYLVTGEIFLHKTAVAVMKLHKRSLMECDFEECVKELTAPIDILDEDEFMSLIDSVKVNAHWGGILERFQHRASPNISRHKDNSDAE